MKIHEYQAKDILKKYGIPVPDGGVAENSTQARQVADRLEGHIVVKAQIHSGGRGKGGGIKVAANPEEAEELAAEIIGMKLVTAQTGPAGRVVKKVLVEKVSDIAQELYLGIVLDRSTASNVIMASAEGGVEIEEVAKNSPEKIIKVHVDQVSGFQPFYARKLGFQLGLNKEQVGAFVKIVTGLYRAYINCDCSLAEINPLVITTKSDMMALDAKMNFDDSALSRHAELAELRDLNEENPAEIEAKKFDLNYISLDGNIGCMVNGAGLAMATMDIIKLYGGEPANFLDVGGAATKDNVAAALKIILSDSKVKGILINIFGGIVKCDMIAEGIVGTAKEMSINVPLVVRLQGTNVEKGREILKASGLKIVSAEGLAEAAEKVVSILPLCKGE